MNDIIGFCSKVFISFLHKNIYFSLVAAVILLGRLLLKRFPKRFSYALWICLGVRALFDIGVSVKLPKLFIDTPAAVNTGANINQTVNPVLFAGNFLANTETIAENTTITPAGPSVLQIVTAGLFAIWTLGFLIMVLKGVMGYIRIRRNTRISYPEGDGLYRCDYIGSPMAFGFVNPKIYIPADIDPNSCRCVIEHERVHIRRGDVYFKLLAFLILSGYWMNPLAWLCFKKFTLDMELSCDEAVIDRIGSRKKKEYMDLLLFYSADRKNVSLAPTAFGETETKRRIKNIMSIKKKTLFTAVFGLLLALAVMLFCFVKFNGTEAMAAETTADASEEVKYDIKDVTIEYTEVNNVESEKEPASEEAETTAADNAPASEESSDITVVAGTAVFPISENLGMIARGYSEDHKALDIAAPIGTPALAMLDGTVEETGFATKEGNYVIVRVSETTLYRYNHLDSASVKAGDTVKAGDKLGEVGSTGLSTGPHLHVEYIVNGESIQVFNEN